MLSVLAMRVNYRRDAPTVERRPVFSLVLGADEPDGQAAKCRLQIFRQTGTGAFARTGDVTLNHPDVTAIPYPEEVPFPAHAAYCARAMVWDGSGEASGWSVPAAFYASFAAPETWSARFISADEPAERAGASPCFWFSRSFSCDTGVEEAVLYMTALGVYKPYVNGRRITRDVLTPGFMDYRRHLSYQRYDVTPFIQRGENRLEVLLGDGWYKGELTSSRLRNYYGEKRELLCELHLTGQSGARTVIRSGEGFTWRLSNVAFSEIYGGELCDAAAREQRPESPVQPGSAPRPGYLHPEIAAPIHEDGTVPPQRLFTSPAGEKILDFGRVLTGTIELRVRGREGDAVVLLCGDTLDGQGNFYNDNVELFSLKGAARPVMQRIEYRLRGGGEERYRPAFTYQCFRYVKIVSFPGEPTAGAFRAVEYTSFTRQTGFFTCGDALVNRLFENVVRTQRATYLDLPVAGPQRAERLGWTGDNQLVAAMSCKTMFDTLSFFGKWLEDVRCDQFPDGQVGVMAPYVRFGEGKPNAQESPMASAAWGDAAVIVPWTLYRFYGDRAILERYYDLARGYVDYMHASGGDEFLFAEGFSFGDWFALDGGGDAYAGKTDQALIASFYFYHSTVLLTKIQKALGKARERGAYLRLAGNIRRKLLKLYFSADGTVRPATQTSCAMAIAFGIADRAPAVARQLAELIRAAGDHLLTGFIGSSVVLQALCDQGYAALAYRLVRGRTYPSWLYCIERGATTVWEHWNSVKPDGSLWDANMNSFCHLTLGSVADWFFTHVLGIQQPEDGAGYRKFLLRPLLDRGLGGAQGSFETVRGEVSVSWRYGGETARVAVTLPVGSEAEVTLPAAKDPQKLALSCAAPGVSGIRVSIPERRVRLLCAGGSYSFAYAAV